MYFIKVRTQKPNHFIKHDFFGLSLPIVSIYPTLNAMKKCYGLLACLWWLPFVLWAQNGGSHTFSFLQLSPSPYTTALGGIQPAFGGTDPATALQNPALLNAQMHGHLSLNTMVYYANINTGYVCYAHHFDSLATFGIGMQYINYGTMDETDVFGQTIGTFDGGEYAFYLSAAKNWGRFSIGTSLQLIASNLAEFSSIGIAADVGLAYSDTASRFQMGLTLQNMGAQLSTYNGTTESLPFDIQFGISKSLRYLPLRFYITAHRLYTWDIRYDDPNASTTNIFGTDDTDKSHFADILFRHFVFGGELSLGKALALRVGYNFLRKQELGLSGQRSLAGFSFGAGIRIKRLEVNYGMAAFHPIGASHHIGLNVRFSKTN